MLRFAIPVLLLFLTSCIVVVDGSGTGQGLVIFEVTVPGENRCLINAGSESGSCARFYGVLSPTTSLTALRGAGSSFDGWSGGCDSVAVNVCHITIDGELVLVSPSFTLMPSCQGVDACLDRTGEIRGGSCNGASACKEQQGRVGGESCIGVNACLTATAEIGDFACFGDDACNDRDAATAVRSCNGNMACKSLDVPVGTNSCNGATACGLSLISVGNNACNGPSACASVVGIVLACEHNTIAVPECAP
jgi:hypothetical protein